MAEKLQFKSLRFIIANQSIGYNFRTLEVLGASGDVCELTCQYVVTNSYRRMSLQVFYGRADFKVQSSMQPFSEHHDYTFMPLHSNNSVLLDDTFPYFTLDNVLVTYNPGVVEPTYNLVRVFNFKVWLLMLLSLAGVTLTYSILCRIKKV